VTIIKGWILISQKPKVRALLQGLPKRRSRGESGHSERDSVRVLADASEIPGLPRDNFEVYDISKQEFQSLQPGKT
jgi:hypothetical protein